jgi:methylaspartate mutase epsilon subunit
VVRHACSGREALTAMTAPSRFRPVTVALGGLGSDSHSVGLLVLARGLQAAGFDLLDLGIQNEFERFAAIADACEAVLISNMDGHAAYYLRVVQTLPGDCLWYIGGNPCVSGDTSELARLGFARVYAGFVEVDDVVSALREDLAGLPRRRQVRPPARPATAPGAPDRDAVLSQWPTGADARDIGANAELLASRPSFAGVQRSAHGVLLHPRSGVPALGDQRRAFATLAGAGADVLSFQIDSLTRNGRYSDVARVLGDDGELNGFPLVNHGVDALRRVSAECPTPLQTRHSASDPRLLAEVSFAGGVTAFEGGPICYNVPYYADLPLDVSLERWEYVDRLTARYAELGVILDREFFGTLTATLLPPCLPIATNLLEALIAVELGVRSVSLAYAEQGCRAQDVAALAVMRRLARQLLGERGDVEVAIVLHQYMGAFPPSIKDSERLIEASATTAALAGVDRVVVKTPCEAVRIPSTSDNVRGLALAARGLMDADAAAYDLDIDEFGRIEASVRALLEAVLALHPGDTAACITEAFARGYLDVPFSPSRYNAGRLLAARDVSGAVRIIDPGDMPLPHDVLAFDRARIGERLAAADVPCAEAWRLVAQDVLLLLRTSPHWPLDDPANLTMPSHMARRVDEDVRERGGHDIQVA